MREPLGRPTGASLCLTTRLYPHSWSPTPVSTNRPQHGGAGKAGGARAATTPALPHTLSILPPALTFRYGKSV